MVLTKSVIVSALSEATDEAEEDEERLDGVADGMTGDGEDIVEECQGERGGCRCSRCYAIAGLIRGGGGCGGFLRRCGTQKWI